MSTRKRPAVVQRPSIDQSAPVPIQGDIMQARRLSQSPTALAQSGHSVNQALSRQSAISSAFRQMQAFSSFNGGAARALHRWATPGRFMDAPPREPVAGPPPHAAAILKDKSPQTNNALAMASASSSPTPEVQAVIEMQAAGMIPGHRKCPCGAAYANPGPPSCLRCNRPMRNLGGKMRGVSGLGGLGQTTLAQPLTDQEKSEYAYLSVFQSWATRMASGASPITWVGFQQGAAGQLVYALAEAQIKKISGTDSTRARELFDQVTRATRNPDWQFASKLTLAGDVGRYFKDAPIRKAEAAAAAAEKARIEQEAIDAAKAEEAAAAAEAQRKVDEANRARQREHELAMAEQRAIQAQAEAEAAALAAEREAAAAAAAQAEAEAEAAAIEAEAQAQTLAAMKEAGSGQSFFEKNRALVIGGGIVLALALLTPQSPITVIK
jgi:hypothetical protein